MSLAQQSSPNSVLFPLMMQQDQVHLAPQLPKYNSFRSLLLIVMNLCISSFYFGYCMGYFSTIQFQFLAQLFNIQITPSTAQGLLIGCITVGAGVGAFLSSYLMNMFSRRNAILATNTLAFGFGLLVLVENTGTLFIARLGQGICVGFYSSIIPVIINELSPPELAGILGTMNQLLITCGVFFVFLFEYILQLIFSDPQSYWFIVFGFTLIIIPVQSAILLFVFPYETPKYLLMNGRVEEGKKLLALIYKEEFVENILHQKMTSLYNNKMNRQNLEQQHGQIEMKEVSQLKNQAEKQYGVAQENKTAATNEAQPLYRLPQKSRFNNLPFIVAIHTSLLQQFVGINVVVAYSPPIISTVLPSMKSIIPIVINLQLVLAALVTTYLLSKFGRKTIIQAGTLISAISLGFVTLGFFIKLPNPEEVNNAASGLIITGLVIFMASFGMTLGPLTWLYIPEIIPATSVPYSTMVNWTGASITIIFFPILTAVMPNQSPAPLFLFFGLWAACSFFINRKFLVETKGKSQKDIQEEFEKIKGC